VLDVVKVMVERFTKEPVPGSTGNAPVVVSPGTWQVIGVQEYCVAVILISALAMIVYDPVGRLSDVIVTAPLNWFIGKLQPRQEEA
jgi:hypothetical protein